MALQIVTEESTTLGSVHIKLKLSVPITEGNFIVADIDDECILGFDMMRKYGLIVDPSSRLLRAQHGDIPILAMEATQQVCSVVDSAQKLLKPRQKMFSAEQIKNLKAIIRGDQVLPI